MALCRVDTTAPELETTTDNAEVMSQPCAPSRSSAVTGNVPRITVDWTNCASWWATLTSTGRGVLNRAVLRVTPPRSPTPRGSPALARTSAFNRRRLGDAARKKKTRHASAIRVWRSACCSVCVSVDTAPSSSPSAILCVLRSTSFCALVPFSRSIGGVFSALGAQRSTRPQAPRMAIRI